jgi:hypothetical protein
VKLHSGHIFIKQKFKYKVHRSDTAPFVKDSSHDHIDLLRKSNYLPLNKNHEDGTGISNQKSGNLKFNAIFAQSST